MRARDNPFRSERILKLRYHLQNESWEGLFKRLAALNYRCAILGPEGSGKTTLLETLGERFARHGQSVRWLRLRSESRSVPAGFSAQPNEIILADGIEQLNFVRWKIFLAQTRRARGLIITTHNPGRLPTLIECVTSPGLLRTLMSELTPEASLLAAESLFERHRGNLRHALRELYDEFARHPQPA